MKLEAHRVLRAMPAAPAAESKDLPLRCEFRERVQSLLPPQELQSEDFASVLEFIERGGRPRGIDYTAVGPELKADGFRKAREYLHQPISSVVGGMQILNSERTYHHPNPNNPDGETFAPIHPLPLERVAEVMDIALDEEECPVWDGQENFERRRRVLSAFLANVYRDRHTYSALMALCQGKTGYEGYLDMQEHFDHWRQYREVRGPELFNEFLLRSNGDTALENRPLEGIVGVWQPFNFSCIGIGDTVAALLKGNSVVIHTSARNIGTYKWLYDKLLEAGVPPERAQFIVPHDDPDDYAKADTAMSEALAAHPGVQLIQFTGSHKVAKLLHAAQADKVQKGTEWLDYRLQAEASGYNPIVVAGFPQGTLDPLRSFLGGHESTTPIPEAWDHFFAGLEREGGMLQNFLRAVVFSTTGLQAHKCSSCKEFVVALDEEGEVGLQPADAAMLKLCVAERLKRVKIGAVEGGGVDMGSLIDRKMHRDVRGKLERVVAEGGQLLTGDSVDDIMHVEGLPNAMKVALYEVPKGNLTSMDKVEIFAPVVRWLEVHGVEGALERVTNLGYALTAAVVAPTENLAKEIRNQMPQGVIYISSDAGGVDGCTGAPAPQIPFGGSGKSGTGSAYRSGSARYSHFSTQEVSRPRFCRLDWGKGLHPSPTSDLLDFIARWDPEGVMAWVRKEIAMRMEG